MEKLSKLEAFWYNIVASDLLSKIAFLRLLTDDFNQRIFDQREQIAFLKKENAALKQEVSSLKTNYDDPVNKSILSARDRAASQRINDLEREVYSLQERLRAANNH